MRRDHRVRRASAVRKRLDVVSQRPSAGHQNRSIRQGAHQRTPTDGPSRRLGEHHADDSKRSSPRPPRRSRKQRPTVSSGCPRGSAGGRVAATETAPGAGHRGNENKGARHGAGPPRRGTARPHRSIFARTVRTGMVEEPGENLPPRLHAAHFLQQSFHAWVRAGFAAGRTRSGGNPLRRQVGASPVMPGSAPDVPLSRPFRR